jgi:pyruvate/2-oxoglutarate dehydrogenase complex dihydrolipoamide acyltransferase (E2) component
VIPWGEEKGEGSEDNSSVIVLLLIIMNRYVHAIYFQFCRFYGSIAHPTTNYIKINLPAMSPTMTEGMITKWYKKEGDNVKQGEVLFEMETDKAQLDVESNEDGILARILVQEKKGKVPVNTPIALMVEEGMDWKNIEKNYEEDSEQKTTTSKTSTVPTVTNMKPMEHLTSLSPAVLHLVDSYDLDPHNITASGPKGRLLKGDVLQYIEKKRKSLDSTMVPSPPIPKETLSIPKTTTPIPPSTTTKYTEIPISHIKKLMAKRWSESKKTIPHLYSSIDCVMDNLMMARTHINSK